MNQLKSDPNPSITCPKCGMTSYNISDILHHYCGNCHQFHDDMFKYPQSENENET